MPRLVRVLASGVLVLTAFAIYTQAVNEEEVSCEPLFVKEEVRDPSYCEEAIRLWGVHQQDFAAYLASQGRSLQDLRMVGVDGYDAATEEVWIKRIVYLHVAGDVISEFGSRTDLVVGHVMLATEISVGHLEEGLVSGTPPFDEWVRGEVLSPICVWIAGYYRIQSAAEYEHLFLRRMRGICPDLVIPGPGMST